MGTRVTYTDAIDPASIPVVKGRLRCRFASRGCSSPAVSIWELSDGCSCFEHDRVQALCGQHAITCDPLGDARLIANVEG